MTKFLQLEQNFSAGLSKLHCTCPDEQFGSKKLEDFIYILSHFDWKTLHFWSRSYRHSCQNCILWVQWIDHFEEFLLKKNYGFIIFFSQFERKGFRLWVKNFLQVCENCSLLVRWNFLGLKNVKLLTPELATHKRKEVHTERMIFRLFCISRSNPIMAQVSSAMFDEANIRCFEKFFFQRNFCITTWNENKSQVSITISAVRFQYIIKI